MRRGEGMSDEQNLTSTTLFAVILLLLCGAVIVVAFPIWREFRYERYPRDYWLKVYLGTAVALAVIYLLIGWVSRILPAKVASRSFFQPVVFFVFMSCVSVFLGTMTADQQVALPVAVQDVHAKFLAEWQFIKFILTVLLPISVISWPLKLIVSRR